MHGYRGALVGLLVLAGCRNPSPRAALLAADSAHARATEADGLASGFVGFLADSAVYLEPGVAYLRGKATIAAHLASAPPGTVLRFRSARVDVSADGTVGYTCGWTELATPGAAVRYGKYLAFWRRSTGGRWEVEAWNRSRATSGAAPGQPALPDPPLRTGPVGAVDPVAEARRLLAVDSAFAALSVARGAAEAFARYAAPDAVTLGSGSAFVIGRQAISQAQAGPPGQVLDWRPALAGVGPLGDLGWTVGQFSFTPARGVESVYGKYLTVWERAPHGWQFVADGGSANPKPGP